MIIPEKLITTKTGKTLVLKSVLASHSARMLEHLIIAHDESYRNLNRSGDYWRTVSVTDEEAILTRFEASKNGFMLGAFEGEKIVGGLGLFGGDPLTCQKFNASLGISIQRAYCGEGLGSAMMKYALEKAREMQLHRIDLTVRTFNLEAQKLYEKLGFRKIGTLREVAFIDGKFEDEHSYELIL